MIDFCVRGEKFSSDENLARSESAAGSMVGANILSRMGVLSVTTGCAGLGSRNKGQKLDHR
jgi:hypothetical protein